MASANMEYSDKEPKNKGKGKGKGRSSRALCDRLDGTSSTAQADDIGAEVVITSEENKAVAVRQEKDPPIIMPPVPQEDRHDADLNEPNSSSFQADQQGMRYSVIVCSKNNKYLPQIGMQCGDAGKSVDSARKVLFATDSAEMELEKPCLNIESDNKWNNWRCNNEIEHNSPNSKKEQPTCNNDKDCEENSSSHNCSVQMQMCRKRLLAMPKFSLSKRSCVEPVSRSSNDVNANEVSPTIDTILPSGLKEWLETYDAWSGSEKNSALNNLIGRSTLNHVRHMMKTIEPLFQTDFISLLPRELALKILFELGPKDLSSVAKTCRYWRYLANDNLLWKGICHKLDITSSRPAAFNFPSICQWKWAYVNQKIIEHNWRTRPPSDVITMRGHDDHVITCLQWYGNKIVSGSDDTTLKVWSTITGECLQTLVGHAGGVWSCQMIDDVVVSGSTDRTLRVWNAVTGKCTKVLGGHTSTVRCMRLHKNKVVSGSRDATLRVWQLPQGNCLQILVGHLAAVRCVQYNGKLVISGAYDFCVKVWNPDTAECLHTLTGHTNRVYTLKFDGSNIVSGSLDTTIRVWDAETGNLKHTLLGHTSLITSMELKNNILVSGNADATLKVWDITTGECLHTLAGLKKHHLSVTYVQLLKSFVISSSDDGTVKLWDLKTGEFIRNLVQLASGGSGGNVLRIRASNTQLVCAVGSRNGTEETKLMLLKFDRQSHCQTCNQFWDH